jgi:glycosyltransferase involved in cell wall biosynthesis
VPTAVNIVSPMPPKPNGIADYCYALSERLMHLAPLRIISDDPFAQAPGTLAVHDPEQAHRYVQPNDVCNYHIGNNPDHGFVLELFRRRPGVVTLHDLNLLYLYETSGASDEAILEVAMRSNPKIGALWTLHRKLRLGGDRSRHSLFDLRGEIVDQAPAIIVHSRFARNLIGVKHGEAAAAKVHVIPHFSPDMGRYNCGRDRAALGLSQDETVVLTCGFATKAKRFDWVVAALDEVLHSGRRFRWIHAGQERPEEFALSDLLAKHKALRARTVVTGYLSESELDLRIGAADILINLRFPSVGESSGTLARSSAAGNCCIVSDTAGYAEIPRDCVAHVPVLGVQPHLVRALVRLIDNPSLRRAIGARARRWAATELSKEVVAKSYQDVFESCKAAPPRRPPPIAAERRTLVQLGDEPESNFREIDGALACVSRKSALVLRYSDDRQLQETFARVPLDLLLARRGLTAGSVEVCRSSHAAGPMEFVVNMQAGR